jgi:iron-sulfur cluster assembly protein
MSATAVTYHAKGVSLTQRGAEKIRALRPGGADASEAGLRVEVHSGGCWGYQYALAFDRVKDGDAVFEDHGLRILVDNRSLPFVDGSSIDWLDEPAGLQVHNPNVVSLCGCGSSFQVAEAQDAPA